MDKIDLCGEPYMESLVKLEEGEKASFSKEAAPSVLNNKEDENKSALERQAVELSVNKESIKPNGIGQQLSFRPDLKSKSGLNTKCKRGRGRPRKSSTTIGARSPIRQKVTIPNGAGGFSDDLAKRRSNRERKSTDKLQGTDFVYYDSDEEEPDMPTTKRKKGQSLADIVNDSLFVRKSGPTLSDRIMKDSNGAVRRKRGRKRGIANVVGVINHSKTGESRLTMVRKTPQLHQKSYLSKILGGSADVNSMPKEKVSAPRIKREKKLSVKSEDVADDYLYYLNCSEMDATTADVKRGLPSVSSVMQTSAPVKLSRSVPDRLVREPKPLVGRRRGRAKGWKKNLKALHTGDVMNWLPGSEEEDVKSKQSAKHLICELGKLFYHLGWATGTGGSISIREGHKIYVAPSGVQKERLSPKDIFTLDLDGNELAAPDDPKLVQSQCTPLFLLAYNCHDAGAVLHSHSKNAVLATLAYPGDEFKITHLEMIKGIYHRGEKRNLRYDETLTVPIIENTPFERDLEDRMHDAILKYPYTNAILVRRHGVYVWGDTWEKAKSMAECYDYLFEMAAQMTRFRIDPTKPPVDITTQKEDNPSSS